MEKINKGIQALRTFMSEVAAETKKATWPARRELVESTFVIIVSVLLLSGFVGVCDKVLATFIRVIVNAV